MTEGDYSGAPRPGPLRVDPIVVAAAESAIAGMVGDYEEWVRKDLAQLVENAELLRAAPGDENLRGVVFQIAHDMKGHGTTFGYDLVTLVGNGLCRFIEKPQDLDPGRMQVIELHVAALKLIVGQKIRGDGGELGAQLVKGLEKITARQI